MAANKTKYLREVILADKEFEGYQKDFLAAILTEPEYTLADAKKIAEAFFNEKENK